MTIFATRVVSNTSPILNLAIIGQLALAQRQFGTVWIPPAVLDELQLSTERPGALELRGALEAGWLCRSELPQQEIVSLLRRELDWGEAEAIALALQWRARYVLLDEREARRVAKSQSLCVTGVIGILIRAKQHGHLACLRDTLDDLRHLAGFYLANEILNGALRAVGKLP